MAYQDGGYYRGSRARERGHFLIERETMPTWAPKSNLAALNSEAHLQLSEELLGFTYIDSASKGLMSSDILY